ncbi:MAG: dUTP diphosphatase [Chitinophagaceae bacterium]
MQVQIVNTSLHAEPAYQTHGAAGMDICANLEQSITLEPMQRMAVPTGIFVAIPDGYEIQVRPRSGLAIKQGITCLNTPGTIDSDYRGEIKIILINLSNEPQTIQNGDRIAQLVVAKYEKIVWQKVESLDETIRGKQGFGSTGL